MLLVKSHSLRPLVWLLAFILLTCAIFIEALHAPTINDQIIPHLDKIAHGAAFAVLAFLLFQFVRSAGFTIRWTVPVAIVSMVTILGIIDECMQAFVPGRTASIGDGLSDISGACIAVFLCFWQYHRGGLHERHIA